MERQPLGKLAPAQPHGASSLRPAHLGPPPASDAAPVKRGRGRPPGAKKWASEPGCKSCRHSKRGCKKCVKNYIPKVSLFVFSYEKLD